MEFLSGIIILAGERQVDVATREMSAGQFPKAWNTIWWTVMSSDEREHLHSGPHVIAHGRLNKVYRIFDDTNDAFVMATRPQINSG